METPEFQGLQLRDQLNDLLKQPLVAKVSQSMRGNISLAAAPGYSAEDLLSQQEKIREIFKDWPIRNIEIPTDRVQVVVRGIPISGLSSPLGAYIGSENSEDFKSLQGLKALKADIETFNLIKL